MKRRQTKKEIHALEEQLLPLVQKYFRAGSSVHRDVIYKLENQIEVRIYFLVQLYLRLDPSWPDRERWLDYFEEFSWERGSSVIRGGTKLWWAHLEHIGGGHVGERVGVYLGTRKRKGLVYLLKLGEGANSRCFSNRGDGISHKSNSRH